MSLGIKKFAVVGAAALGVIAFNAPNASATSQQTGWVKMKINTNCTIKLYVDDHQFPGKIRAQAHLGCSRGGNLFTAHLSIDRDRSYSLSRKTVALKWIDEDKGFGGWETTTADKPGTQCYKARIHLIYPEPGDTANSQQIVKTPCLNT
ncbi:hypothetical protein ABZO31_14495 [Streptomyces sp. HUAS MG47]|uniref:hypothetical protein n=1 Tax=Streptomyces solicamelliae TaxID=3231716 RepID=UPI003877DE5E